MGLFKILKKDSKTDARVGVLTTPNGKVETPSYVFVGTYGQIRYLSPRDIKKTKTQMVIANTFHLWDRAGKSKTGIRKEIGEKLGKLALMTDSGGFQVLSLAFGLDNKVGKFLKDDAKKIYPAGRRDEKYKRQNVKITEKGVYFTFNGKKKFLGPKLSMGLQSKIGADIIFAFDQITSPLDSYAYNKKAVITTTKWAKECLRSKDERQFLFGIIQGGLFKELRIKSAKSIGTLPFDGFGIGGSYTKKQISQILDWIIPYLPEEKPRHLLGVGKIEDIFEAVERGVDTFDCVIPTREARHGRIYTKKGIFDIRMGRYSNDKKTIETNCKCPTCSKLTSKSKIRSLLKGREAGTHQLAGTVGRETSVSLQARAQGQRWCLMHNMWFFNTLLENIRSSIKKNRYKKFRDTFLKKFNSPKS